jgi:N-alpha-acetyltransferase 30
LEVFAEPNLTKGGIHLRKKLPHLLRMAAVKSGITYVDYTDEAMLQEIQVLVAKDLSEPYSVFTYRYFLHKWPSLCVCVYSEVGEKAERGEMIAAIVCKADNERGLMKGYIAMLAVSKSHRNRGIGLKVG